LREQQNFLWISRRIPNELPCSGMQSTRSCDYGGKSRRRESKSRTAIEVGFLLDELESRLSAAEREARAGEVDVRISYPCPKRSDYYKCHGHEKNITVWQLLRENPYIGAQGCCNDRHAHECAPKPPRYDRQQGAGREEHQ